MPVPVCAQARLSPAPRPFDFEAEKINLGEAARAFKDPQPAALNGLAENEGMH